MTDGIRTYDVNIAYVKNLCSSITGTHQYMLHGVTFATASPIDL